jgi:hypothetical protein
MTVRRPATVPGRRHAGAPVGRLQGRDPAVRRGRVSGGSDPVPRTGHRPWPPGVHLESCLRRAGAELRHCQHLRRGFPRLRFRGHLRQDDNLQRPGIPWSAAGHDGASGGRWPRASRQDDCLPAGDHSSGGYRYLAVRSYCQAGHPGGGSERWDRCGTDDGREPRGRPFPGGSQRSGRGSCRRSRNHCRH